MAGTGAGPAGMNAYGGLHACVRKADETLRASVDLSDAWTGAGFEDDGSDYDEDGGSSFKCHDLTWDVLQYLAVTDSDRAEDGSYEGSARSDTAASRLRRLLWATRGFAPAAAVIVTLCFVGVVSMGWGTRVQ